MAGGLSLGMLMLRQALAGGSVPVGVARVRGDARINGKPAVMGMVVQPGDVITTAAGANLTFVVGQDAFLVRPASRIELQGTATRLLVDAMRVVTGGVLTVFRPGDRKQIRTVTATIGIRGTGIYIEVEPQRTYACTCYGEAELTPVDDPRLAEIVRTRHHDEPRYIYAKGMPRLIEQAPMINHTDAELIMLEALLWREPPFLDSGNSSY